MVDRNKYVRIGSRDIASAQGCACCQSIESTLESCVRVDVLQTFNGSQKSVARTNIGAVSSAEAAAAAPVQTVNNMVGFVSLDAASVGADPAGAAATALEDAKDYADAITTASLRDCGNFDASGGAYPSTGGTGVGGAIVQGNMWRITVAGVLPTGVSVSVGDWIRALIDSPGNTQANWAIAESNLGYVPLQSLNGRTTQAAVAQEYILEQYHNLVILATDCAEETSKSQFTVGVSQGAISNPATATGMDDATGIWRFTGTGSSQGQFTARGNSGANKSLRLSSEPIVAVGSFTIPLTLAEPYVCLSLQQNTMFGDVFYGCDTTNGIHIILHVRDGQMYFITRAAGVDTGTKSSVPHVYSPDTRYNFVIVATSTAIQYYLNGALMFTHTSNIPTVDMVASFGSLDHAASSFFGHVLNLDVLEFFRLYKTTPRNLGIPNITY